MLLLMSSERDPWNWKTSSWLRPQGHAAIKTSAYLYTYMCVCICPVCVLACEYTTQFIKYNNLLHSCDCLLRFVYNKSPIQYLVPNLSMVPRSRRRSKQLMMMISLHGCKKFPMGVIECHLVFWILIGSLMKIHW